MTRMGRSRNAAVIGLVLALTAGLGACHRGGSDNSGATVAGFCRLVKQEDARLADLAGTRALLDRAATDVKKLERAAPSEIEDDVQLLADGYRRAANGDFASLASKVGRIVAAAKHVATYTKDKCNFDINAR
jgi:hypothetical protein